MRAFELLVSGRVTLFYSIPREKDMKEIPFVVLEHVHISGRVPPFLGGGFKHLVFAPGYLETEK